MQGKTKGLQKKSPSSARHAARAAAAPKKGKRYIAPKKSAAVKQASVHKACYKQCSQTVPIFIMFLSNYP
jgi:hypothetical protein